MPSEKLINLEFTPRECALLSSLLQRAAREFVLLPTTAETARKLALRFALGTEITVPCQAEVAAQFRP